MIRINKTRPDQNGLQISPGEDWFHRSSMAREDAISKAESKDHRFLAHVYGAPEVKACLRELFFNKCAYCEYPLTRSDMNVEHYRPKARVAESPNHLGYYWLAYDWANLLPACQFCNQLRKETPERGITPTNRTSGKGDKFPLVDKNQRAYSPNDKVSRENPLLINPTVEEPSEHITFDPTGIPLPLSEKGRVSIDIYNLNTRQLNVQRERIIRETAQLYNLRSKARANPHSPEAQQILHLIENWIEKKTEDSADYAAAARAVAKEPERFGLQEAN